MATDNDIIQFAEDLANAGVGTDADGSWGRNALTCLTLSH